MRTCQWREAAGYTGTVWTIEVYVVFNPVLLHELRLRMYSYISRATPTTLRAFMTPASDHLRKHLPPLGPFSTRIMPPML